MKFLLGDFPREVISRFDYAHFGLSSIESQTLSDDSATRAKANPALTSGFLYKLLSYEFFLSIA